MEMFTSIKRNGMKKDRCEKKSVKKCKIEVKKSWGKPENKYFLSYVGPRMNVLPSF